MIPAGRVERFGASVCLACLVVMAVSASDWLGIFVHPLVGLFILHAIWLDDHE